MIDGNEADDKIIAVLEADRPTATSRTWPRLPRAMLDRLRHYFLTYKQIPGEEAQGGDRRGLRSPEAHEVIRRSMKDYQRLYGTGQSGTLLAHEQRKR